MKNTILVLIFALITTTAFTQEANVAIIYPFDKYDNVKTTNEIYLQSQLSEKIIDAEFYNAFTRSDINAIIDEHRFQETGMVNDDEIQKIGDMTGATHICVSNFIAQNNNVILTAKIIEIETGQIIAEQSVETENTYSLIQSYCRTIASYLNKKLPPIQQIYPTISYSNVNEAVIFINERIIYDSISIENNGIVWIGSFAKFKITKIIFSYSYSDFMNKKKYGVAITCKNNNCITEHNYNGHKQKKSQTYTECRTKKDAQDVVKAFQFIQSQF